LKQGRHSSREDIRAGKIFIAKFITHILCSPRKEVSTFILQQMLFLTLWSLLFCEAEYTKKLHLPELAAVDMLVFVD
jgi:hypothetical protein